MQHEPQKAIDFLQRLSSPFWTLTAISLDKKSIETVCLDTPEQVAEWLQKNPDRNIYYALNPLRYKVTRKASREDVRELAFCHVDIDPRAGEDLTEERQRALKLLQSPPGGISKPTWIVFSGGGMQAGWKLVEPMVINGEEALYQSAARYNQALELAFGADECHNVDRILRLPGTVNFPDDRKRKKGRTETIAELVEWDDSRIYPLSKFIQAPAVQLEQKGFGHTTSIQVSGNIKRIDDVNELPKISDLCKVVIVQGTDPDRPDRFPSRSEALFFVCCEMVRADLNDDTMYSVITDPDFGISASILDKGRNAEGYAKKQIERARQRAIDPHLLEMNDKYAVVGYGGKMRVIYEDWDAVLERQRLVKMSFEDFCRKYMNVAVQIGTDAKGNPRYMPMGQWWLKHEKRRQYEKITFAPGRETPTDYNMWRGFAYEPTAGDKHHQLLVHIRENICGGEQVLYDYVMGWMAWAVQHPDQPGQTAIVLRGDMGVGKGFLARTFGKLFGRHFIHVSNAQHLTGNFNAHLRDCTVLFADEAFFAGDRRHASMLKALVTEDSIIVEPKGIDAETVPNCLHILMASNEDWVVPAGIRERRFCVLDVSSAHIQDAMYFGRIAEAMRAGGYANLLHALLSTDLLRYDVRAVPQTKALQDQKIHSFEPTHDWWYGKLRDGKLLAEHGGWKKEVLVEELTADFVEHIRVWGQQIRRTSATKLGHFMRLACPGDSLRRRQDHIPVTIGDKLIQRPYYYIFPPLAELRRHWDEKFGGPYTWPVVEESEEVREPF